MVLNAELIFHLVRYRLNARLYHFSCVISAVSSFYMALLVTIMVDVSVSFFIRAIGLLKFGIN